MNTIYEVQNKAGRSTLIHGATMVTVGTSIAGTSFNNLMFSNDAGDVIALFPDGHWAGVKRLTSEDMAEVAQGAPP